ncbi:hypothetical protein ACEQUB_02425 [Ralstonia syzygii]
MKRFIEGEDRKQVTLLPECLDDFVAEDNPVRIIDAFVEELDLGSLGFDGSIPSATGRPSYHPAVLLKIYIYGYLNRVQSSRRLERECQRNVELMWLTGRLAPDFKTIADFRRDNGTGIRNVCRRFVVLCRDLKLFSQALVAIDGSKFKAVNTRDRNFTAGKVDKRQQQIEESIQRYLNALETADRTQPAELEAKTTRLRDKIVQLREQMRSLDQVREQLKTQPDGQLSMTDPDARSMATSGRGSGMVGYNVQVAVDAKHHLIVAHEVTNAGSDRAQLSPWLKPRAMPWARPGSGQSLIVATSVALRSRPARMPVLPRSCRSPRHPVRRLMVDSIGPTSSTLLEMTNTNALPANVRSTASPARNMACNYVATGAVPVPSAP